jgi:hypothetical protein
VLFRNHAISSLNKETESIERYGKKITKLRDIASAK